jgi:hypothetical protein
MLHGRILLTSYRAAKWAALNNTSRSLARNFGAESYIPKYVRDKKDKACTAIR